MANKPNKLNEPRVASLIPAIDYPGFKLLKCYNRKKFKWYVAKANIIVPANSTIVYPKKYYYNEHKFTDNYEIPNPDARTNRIKIVHIEKENKYDTCIPLFYGAAHKNKIEYEEGKTYETDVDTDVEKELGKGFYFKETNEELEKYVESVRFYVESYNE